MASITRPLNPSCLNVSAATTEAGPGLGTEEWNGDTLNNYAETQFHYTNLAHNVHVYVYFTTGHKVPSQWPYSLCVVTVFSVCKPVKAVIDWLKDLVF